jgi:ParB-like chromosome segregation protein Spo0J
MGQKVAWSGPKDIPLDEIDFDNAKTWNASHNKAKVKKFVGKIQGGFKKPAILVKGPDSERYRVADGHHRVLAYHQLNKPVRAYVAHVSDPDVFAEALEMHASQKRGNR